LTITSRSRCQRRLWGVVAGLLARAATFFVVRTNRLDAFEPWILAPGFERAAESPARPEAGLLRVYRRVGSATA